MTDRQLLLQHLDRDPAAFEQLVRRHIDMVYAAATRQVGPTSADDITQAVFLMLAQKAHALRHRESVAGWLYRAAGFCCSNFRRLESRRQKHERESAAMIPTMHPPAADASDFPELSALLDAALASLSHHYREAVLLRHMQQLDYAHTAAALHISEEAARKRTDRGLQKLRLYFAAHGHPLTPKNLTQSLASSALAAPAALLSSTLLTAHASLTSGTSAALIAKGALYMMSATKIKLSLIAALLLLILLPAVLIISRYASAGGNQKHVVASTAQTSEPLPKQTLVASSSAPAAWTFYGATLTEPAAATTAPAAMDLLVVDKDSHDPIPGLAIITAGGAIPRFNGVTDAQGRIQVPLPKTDKYPYFNVAVHGNGYAFKTLRWFPGSTTMAGKPFTTYTLQMERSATVRGTLLDENSNPIPRASVMLSFDKTFADPHEIFDIGGSEGFVIVKTDNVGRFTYNAAPATCDTIEIGASDDTHLAQPAEPYKSRASLYDGTAEIKLHTGGVLVQGTVVDDTGNPVPKALALASTSNYIAQKTDAAGKFAFRLPPNSDFSLYVQAKSFAPDTQKILLTKDPQTLTIHLHPK